MATSSVTSLRPSIDDAAASWVSLIDEAREQHRRLAEETHYDREAFLAARLPAFRPSATVSEELGYLRSLTRPTDVWMDVGAGAGRLALPLAGSVRRMIAVEPSPTMQDALHAAIAEAGLAFLALA